LKRREQSSLLFETQSEALRYESHHLFFPIFFLIFFFLCFSSLGNFVINKNISIVIVLGLK